MGTMKKLVDKLTDKQKREIKSYAIDLFVRGEYNTTEECWIFAVLSKVNSLGVLDNDYDKLDRIQKLVDSQAEDDGLWFIPESATEDYLQVALRELHTKIEE